MRVIYDELSGDIFCVTDKLGDIKPKVFDVVIPEGKMFKNLIVNAGGEPLVEFEDIEKSDIEKELEKIKEELLSTKLAIAEYTMSMVNDEDTESEE